MSDGINRIDIAEFRAFGYLQEVNRLFLHPHGLALEVVREDDGTERLGGVWDYRDDPEGMNYAPGQSLNEKANRVAAEWDRRALVRLAALGYIVQPIDREDVPLVVDPTEEPTTMSERPQHAFLDDREYVEGGWRHSTYRRPDGSTFHVAIPSMEEAHLEHPGQRYYDESAEAEMLLRLAGPRVVGEPDRTICLTCGSTNPTVRWGQHRWEATCWDAWHDGTEGES